jgi:death on curing protein
MKLTYFTLEEVLRLHFQIIEDFGGVHGIRDEERLQSLIEAPKLPVFGAEQYPDLKTKAAVYVRNVIGDHPFSDGNKRTAITVCSIFLARNGVQLTATPEELEAFTIHVATNNTDIKEISTRLYLHSL